MDTKYILPESYGKSTLVYKNDDGTTTFVFGHYDNKLLSEN